jgi:RNA polymerase sigma-70 factor (ECF subfamily)
VSIERVSVEEFDGAYPALFGELTSLCRALGVWDEAEDVAQESILYARTHLGALRDPQKLRPWLRKIAARGAAGARRRRLPSLDPTAPAYLPLDREAGLDCASAVARLPDRQRQAVALVYGLGYEQEDAAQLLGISRGALAATLWKARRHLARDLGDPPAAGPRPTVGSSGGGAR